MLQSVGEVSLTVFQSAKAMSDLANYFDFQCFWDHQKSFWGFGFNINTDRWNNVFPLFATDNRN